MSMEQQKALIAAAKAKTVKAPSFYGGGCGGHDAADLQVMSDAACVQACLL